MGKLKDFEFIIKENEFKKVVIVFDSNGSHVHGFGDEPPITWEGVYKVYMQWRIDEHSSFVKGVGWTDEYVSCKTIYDEPCDENSGLDQLIYYLKTDEIELDKYHDVRSFGNDTHYLICKRDVTWNPEEYDDVETEYAYTIFVYDSYNGYGYRFVLEDNKAKELAMTIESFYEYMLQNSQGI